ncbi:hypothetical protein [Paenibacillus sp. CMAA1364]
MTSQIQDWANLSLHANIYIKEVNGNKVYSKSRPIFLMELGENSICFLSDLDLPLLPNIMYGFDIQNTQSKVMLTGQLQHKGMYEQRFQYRVSLINNLKGINTHYTSVMKKMLLHLDYFKISNPKGKSLLHRRTVRLWI